MKTEFPGWKFVSATVSGTLDTSIVEKADHVFFFSDTISHSTYYMGRSFSKEFLLKLINQNRDVQMDENEMMKRLKAFKGSDIVEYNGYIISDYWDEADEDHVDMDIENEIETSAYIPTVQEIDEFYYRGFLFSKHGYQKLYKFFVKVLGNEAKAYMKTLDVWGMFQVLSDPEEVVIELDDGDFTDPDKSVYTDQLEHAAR